MKTSILIIDDDPSYTDLVSLALRSNNFDVVAVNTGEEGIKHVREKTPQIVLLDLMMPQMDGWQTCRAIRSFSSVAILVLSPLNDASTVASILDAGADDVLVRPVATAVLLAHLKRLARRATAPGPPGRDNPEWHPSTHPLAS